MIEKIDIERCTSCGICDDVCPADVIHMEAVPVAPEVSCEIFCPEQIVDVHPSVKNRPRPW